MHRFGDLSAYLDGALSSEARASMEAHLDMCGLCRTRLAELRGTARLIAGLPAPVPSRSLVPRVSVPVWLAPLRTLSTFASGAAIFLFLATAILTSFPRSAATSAGSAPAAAPAPNTLSAPQPASSPQAAGATGAPSQFNVSAPSPAPPPNTDRTAAGGPGDAAKEVGRQEGASPSSNVAADQSTQVRRDAEPAPLAFLTAPWAWLLLGLLFAAVSLILGRRLRSA